MEEGSAFFVSSREVQKGVLGKASLLKSRKGNPGMLPASSNASKSQETAACRGRESNN